MAGQNNTNIKITLQANEALSKSKQLGTNIKGIGTSSKTSATQATSSLKGVGTTLQGVTTAANATRTSITTIGGAATTTSQAVRAGNNSSVASFSAVSNSANLTRSSVTSIGVASGTTSQMVVRNNTAMSASFNQVGQSAGTASGRMAGMGGAMSGAAIGGALFYTSLSNVDKAAKKVMAATDSLATITSTLTYYQERQTAAVEAGTDSGVAYEKLVRDITIYTDKQKTATYNLSIAQGNVDDVNIQMLISGGLMVSMVASTIIQVTGLNVAMVKNKIITLANSVSSFVNAGSKGAMATTSGISATAIGGLTVATGVNTAGTWLNNAAMIVFNALKGPYGWAILAGAGIAIAGATAYMLLNTEETEKNNDATKENQKLTQEQIDILEETEKAQQDANNAVNDGSVAYENETRAIKNNNIALINHNKLMAIAIEQNTKKNDFLDKVKSFGGYKAFSKEYDKNTATGYNKIHEAQALNQFILNMANPNMGSKNYTYSTFGSGGWSAQNQADKESNMAANMTAHKAAQRRRLDIKDGLANMLRSSGLGFGAMKLSDGSQIRTIRGHLTGKRRSNDASRGYQGFKELEGRSSAAKAGRESWGKFSSSVGKMSGMVMGGYGGDAVGAFKRYRTTYLKDMENIMKKMLKDQLKDKTMNDAEIDRLRLLDGSKAKEYYNKVGTHEAYDVYDRMNYRQFRTDMQGGACVNT